VVLHLSAPEAQRVRLLVLGGATGAALADEEHEVEAGAINSISLSFPAGKLAHAAASASSTQQEPNPAGANDMQAIIPLRLIITTPAHPHNTSTHLPTVNHLLATATLLAALAPLASELCSLHTAMVEQERGAGLGVQEVLSNHWHLMDDICLLSALARGAAEAGLDHQQAASTVTEVATRLHQFFCLNTLPAWQEEVAQVLDIRSSSRHRWPLLHILGPQRLAVTRRCLLPPAPGRLPVQGLPAPAMRSHPQLTRPLSCTCSAFAHDFGNIPQLQGVQLPAAP
jgi:hypothetical protein